MTLPIASGVSFAMSCLRSVIELSVSVKPALRCEIKLKQNWNKITNKTSMKQCRCNFVSVFFQFDSVILHVRPQTCLKACSHPVSLKLTHYMHRFTNTRRLTLVYWSRFVYLLWCLVDITRKHKYVYEHKKDYLSYICLCTFMVFLY